MGAHSWMVAFVLYFIGLTVVVSLMSLSGVLSGSGATVTTPSSLVRMGEANSTSIATPDMGFKWSAFFADVFSFFVFNISYTGDTVLMQYMWLVRLIFVYVPLMILVLTFYYSLPGVNG